MPADRPFAPDAKQTERHLRLLDALPTVDQLYAEHRERHHIPGVAHGIVFDGELLYAGAVGVGDIEAGTPVTPATTFRIASMTKSFTALAILHLRDAGKLRLDDRVEEYVPEVGGWTYPTADSPRLTIRHLLTMSSGLPQDDPWADRQLALSDSQLSALLAGGATFSNMPGVTFEYSNLGYMVLGQMVTNVARLPVDAFITQQILEPLGMGATLWEPRDAPADRFACGYRWQADHWLAEGLISHGGSVAAFGGLYSNVPDLARYVAYFLAGWTPNGAAHAGPLESSSLREMQQLARYLGVTHSQDSFDQPMRTRVSGYGYGLSVIHEGERTTVAHSGGLPGYGSNMRWAPGTGLGVVALGNLTYAPMGEIAERVLVHLISATALLSTAKQAAPALKAARAGLNRLLASWDDAQADKLFAENFFLDEPRNRRREEIERLGRVHGQLRPEATFRVETALQGEWKMLGDRGWCTVWISLSPTVPPRIQELEIDSVLPPSGRLLHLVDALAALTGAPTKRGLRQLCASTVDLGAVYDQMRFVAVRFGDCRVGEILGGDGDTWARFRLESSGGTLIATLTLDPKSGKATEVRLRPALPD